MILVRGMLASTARTPARPRWRPLMVATAACILLGAPNVSKYSPRLIWNLTGSVPTGLYLVRPGAPMREGVLAAVKPPEPLATWLAQRDHLGRGVPLIKRVVALPGARVCRFGDRVIIQGTVRARARTHDRHGRALPMWSGCMIVKHGQLFLLNAGHPDSLDGRYFGPLPRSAVLGRATPLVVADGR